MASNSMGASDSTTVTEPVEASTTAQTNDDGTQPEETDVTQPATIPGEDPATENAAASDAAPAQEPSGTTRSRPKAGPFAGAGAIISAALGLGSLTGTPLSEMLRSRAQLSGQIEAQTGGNADQIDMLYSTPWHTAALSNAIIAVVSVLIGCGVLVALLRAESRLWVRSVTVAGVVLGLLGLLVSGGMYFDLFVSPPEMPTMPGPGGMPR